MAGRTSPTLRMSPISKWTAVNQTMRNRKLGILCIQETHLNQDHLSQVVNLFSRRLAIFNTSDPTRPGSSAGIAFVLNKELVDASKAEMNIIIPGRAAVLTLKWHNEKIIKILNIYTPNNPSEHQAFWLKIGSEWSKLNIGKPDFMVGDFNITEDPIDQAPARLDNENAIGALRDLRNTLKLQDTWRIEHPNERKFTFSSNHQTMSCLDRIYTSDQLANSLLDWDSHVSPIPTDHHMISVRYAPPGLPHIAQTKMENLTPRTAEANPQLIWCDFKNNISNLAKETAKAHLNKINQRIKTLLKDLRKTMNSQNIDTSQDARTNTTMENEPKHPSPVGNPRRNDQ
ncbi:Endonuclease/exonuclease/phosphatase [Suillus occidentalis]|nr:Endonuclease/exonuclease/phosphatase [Suillus occidentalis]